MSYYIYYNVYVFRWVAIYVTVFVSWYLIIFTLIFIREEVVLPILQITEFVENPDKENKSISK